MQAIRLLHKLLELRFLLGKGKGKGLDTCYSAAYIVRLMTSSVLQSRKWQLIGMSQSYRSAICGHPLATDSWTHGAASRHTIAPISYISPRSPQ